MSRAQWYAAIGSERTFLGAYATAVEAAIAYDAAAMARWGALARTNSVIASRKSEAA